MSERHWEMYRLSVIERIPDSPYKEAVIEAIRHKLRMLEMLEASANPIHEVPKGKSRIARAGH